MLKTVLAVVSHSADDWTKQAVYTKSNDLLFPLSLPITRLATLVYAAEVDDGDETAGHDRTPRDMEPTTVSHFVGASSIVASVVNGKPMRAACGRWLVSQQNPDGMDVCSECEEQLPDFGAVRDILRTMSQP